MPPPSNSVTLNLFPITHTQLARVHRIILLKLMEKICKAHIECVSEDQASKLITLSSAELTMSTEVTPDWQGAASRLLSTLGIRYAHLVMKELLVKFQPGGNPHYFVVFTLGLLATSNGRCLDLLMPLIRTYLQLRKWSQC